MPTDSPPKNLILGLIAGYHYGDVRPFAASLMEHARESTRCVLFASPTTRGIDDIRSHGITVVSFDRPPEYAHLPYNGYRYILYRDFLRTSTTRYHRILLTDTRDVIFQADPFSRSWPSGLNATLEERTMSIGRCPHNSRWVEGHLGAEALRHLHEKPISCSGTTIADHDTALDYLDVMQERMRGFHQGPNMAGFDQAIHNHMIQNEFNSKTTFHDNAGPILTLGYYPGDPKQDHEGRVLNAANQPALLVHQYDRKPRLFAALRKNSVHRHIPDHRRSAM